MDDLTHCPNCNTKLKGLMSSVKMLGESDLQFARDFGDFEGEFLCGKCSSDIMTKAKSNYIRDNHNMNSFLEKYCSSFPIVTIQNPDDWKYETLGMVTAQATMNNQVENKSFLDNLLGINQNLVDLDGSVNIGESICLNILRQKTYMLGGNAVVGVDIDYSEFGLKGELMLVCMAGTAVKVEGLEAKYKRYSKLKLKHEEMEDKMALLNQYTKVR